MAFLHYRLVFPLGHFSHIQVALVDILAGRCAASIPTTLHDGAGGVIFQKVSVT
jgi:hypothetical protein